LEKEIKKGNIPPKAAQEEEDLDEDLDAIIDEHIKTVWGYYDKKNQGSIDKKTAQQFFKDALGIHALRVGQKPKDLLAPGQNMGKALDAAFRQLDTQGTGRVDYKQFEEYISANDLEEALGVITGNTGGVQISMTGLAMVDVDSIGPGGQVQAGHIEFRDYGDDDE